MPNRLAPLALLLTVALPYGGMASAAGAESNGGAKPSLSARELRFEVQCHLPRSVPCAIRKPPLSGYHLLTEKITLDDRGSYWIADLSRGKNEPIRILSDNGVLHLIDVKYLPGPATATPAAKPRKEGTEATGKPGGQEKTKEGGKATKPANLDACYERCRSTP